jgi:tight adherence protein C
MANQLIEKVDTGLARPEVFVAALTFAAVLFLGIVILLVRNQYRRRVHERLETGRAGMAATGPGGSWFLRFLEQFGNYVSHGRASTSLWEQLVRAGYMTRAAPAIYTGIKLLLFVAGMAAATVLILPTDFPAPKKIWLITMGGALPFFLPNLVIRMQEKKRRQEIRQYLPDAVDLLEICVSSGIGLDMAWNMVAEEIHHVSPVLGTAMDLSNFEMHLGTSRTDAMRNMAVRTGAEQLSSLAAILVQSERFGTSVATALEEFATWMRDERHLRAEEEAEKLPTKLLFPMALFIFPAILVVAIGPAMIHIFRVLGGQ